MTKKKAKKTTKRAVKSKKAKKSARKRRAPRIKKAVNPEEVRKDIAKIVGSGAKKVTQAVLGEAMKGQLAPAKFLFEVAGVYPPAPDGEQATQEEDCLAKLLLERISPPKKAAGDEEGKGLGEKNEEQDEEDPRDLTAAQGEGNADAKEAPATE